VVLDMLELIIKTFAAIYIIRVVIKHNLFVSKLVIKVKFFGIHIEVDSKEKKHPSDQGWCFSQEFIIKCDSSNSPKTK
jgi:hypothetical protein